MEIEAEQVIEKLKSIIGEQAAQIAILKAMIDKLEKS